MVIWPCRPFGGNFHLRHACGLKRFSLEEAFSNRTDSIAWKKQLVIVLPSPNMGIFFIQWYKVEICRDLYFLTWESRCQTRHGGKTCKNDFGILDIETSTHSLSVLLLPLATDILELPLFPRVQGSKLNKSWPQSWCDHLILYRSSVYLEIWRFDLATSGTWC